MTTLPNPPFVPIEGVQNFRDLGGYPTNLRGSGSLRRRQLYRCAEPSQITPAGAAALRDLGVTTSFDLRSRPELERVKERSPVIDIAGVRRVFVPVFQDSDYSPEQIAVRYRDYASQGTEGFRRAYLDILKAAPSAYRTILLHLAAEPSSPCVMHCTAGKDRTGVLAALILSLCGVDDETIAREYALTELGLAPLRSVFLEHLLKESALEGNMDGAVNMVSAK